MPGGPRGRLAGRVLRRRDRAHHPVRAADRATRSEALEAVTIYPGKQFVTPAEKLRPALLAIREELGERIAWFEKEGKLLEAQRIKMRTEYDLEMMEEMGFCSGIENYSRHLAGRPPGSRPCTLFDFFPKDYLLVIDESHATVPQIGGMYEGDRSRKTVLVDYGFRLPSALDNRPLNFEEFQSMQNQTHLRQRDARAARAGMVPGPGRRADRPAHRPGGSEGDRQAADGPD